MELRIRTGVLTALPGVGVPVASAILALVDPETYGVLDFRAWRQVFPKKRVDYSVSGYLRYMQKIWPLVDELQWTAQEVDLASACQKMDICLNPKNKWRFKIAKNFDVR